MMKSVLVLLVLCSWAQGEGDEYTGKECGPYLMQDCCRVPRFLPKNVFHDCIGVQGSGFRGPGGVEKYLEELKKMKEARAAGAKGQGSVTPTVKPQVGGPYCVMECVMKNMSLLKSGEIDEQEFIKQIADTANATWSGLLKDGATACLANLSKVDMSTTPAPKGKNQCSPKSAFFVMCLRKYLAVNCPDGLSGKNDRDLKCDDSAKQKSGLRNCNPFSSQMYLILRKMALRSKKKKTVMVKKVTLETSTSKQTTSSPPEKVKDKATTRRRHTTKKITTKTPKGN